MSKKTVTVFAATGTAGRACVEELIRQDVFNVQVLVRKSGMVEKTSVNPPQDAATKHAQWVDWQARGVTIRHADVTNAFELISALKGTDYLVSCVPITATESQYPLIWAAKEAGVERFVPSEFGLIYEWEQSLPTPTLHRALARQKVFIRQVIELAGLDYTIIPAGFWPEYYLLEPVSVMGKGQDKIAWSAGQDVGRIIPHVLAHPASRNATCAVAATAYCSWDELIDVRERLLGRKIARAYLDNAAFRAAYAGARNHAEQELTAIGVAATEAAAGMPLFGNWNATYLPEFKGTPLEVLFPTVIEPTLAAMRAAMAGTQ
ncbi:NmrA family NAD(P)-binding protein [Aquipseudomonas alcaligenes]|nr:NmrA family NAD(P)-binding protein [Pseudomonas alcaligenes]